MAKAIGLGLASLSLGAGIAAHAASIVGVTPSGALIEFDSAAPGTVLSVHAVSGIAAGESVVGIDVRPADQALYALTHDAGSHGALYRIDARTGAATLVTPLMSGVAPYAGLVGDSFAIDFNPTVDRLRVVAAGTHNLRVNPNTGQVIEDTTVAYAPGDANMGSSPFVIGVGYTNSRAGAATTTLYAVDYDLDGLAIMNPPNNGALNTVGPFGVVTHAPVGFDIDGADNAAYVSFEVGGIAQLYTVNLATGAATLVGTIGSGTPLVDIAVGPDLLFRNGFD